MTKIVELYNNGKRYIGELVGSPREQSSTGTGKRHLRVKLLNFDLILKLTYNDLIRKWIFPNGEMIDRVVIKRATLQSFRQTDGFVLPIFEIIDNGKRTFYALLGRETKGSDRGTFDSFGGKTDRLYDSARGQRPRAETPLETASREFWEEGLLKKCFGWSLEQTKRFVQENSTVMCFYDGHKSHVLYFTFFSANSTADLITRFMYHAKRTLNAEKDKLAVVSILEIQRSLREGDDPLGLVETPDRIRMRPIFRKLMRSYLDFRNPFHYISAPGVRFYSI